MSANQQIVTLIAKAQDKMSPVMTSIGKAAVGLTAIAVGLITTIIKLGESMAATGAELFNGARATGTSVEGYQALNYTLEQTTGVSNGASGALRAMNTFMRTAATGSAEYVKVLDSLGLKYEDLEKMSPENAFITITNALGGLDDAMQQNIAATTVFGGRYAQGIVGALNQTEGSLQSMMDSFNESGRAISTEQVTILKAYDDALTDVQYDMKKLGAEVIVPLIPIMKDVLQVWGELAKDAAPALASVALALADAFGEFMDEMGTGAIDRLNDFIWAIGQVKDGLDLVPDPLREVRDSILEWVSPLTQVNALWDATIGTLHDADEAVDQLEEAERRLGETQRELQITLVDQARAIEENNIPALMNMKAELSSMEFGEHADQIQAIDDALHAMSVETVANTVVALDNALAMAEQMSAMQGFNLVMDGTIARLKAQRDAAQALGEQILMDTATTVDITASTSTEAAGEDPEVARMNAINEEKKNAAAAFEQARIEAAEELHQLKMEHLAEEEEAEQNGIRQKRQSNLAAENERAEAQARIQEQVMGGLANWSGAFALAMAQGGDSARAFGEAMANEIIKIVAMSGFKMLMSLVTGGASGGIGGLFGSFFKFSAGSGGAGIPKAAAGLNIIPGNPGSQTDDTLVIAKSGEMISSRTETARQIREYSQGSGGNTYQFIDQSMISTASASRMAEAMAVLDELDRKRGTA